MNFERVDQIAKAVLYEGYMLYPYRPSSVKNRQRFNFGVLYPQACSQVQAESERSWMRIECLVNAPRNQEAIFAARLRFLHLQSRSPLGIPHATGESLPEGWQEAVEREVSFPDYRLQQHCREPVEHYFSFPSETRLDSEHVRRHSTVGGIVKVSAHAIRDGIFKVRVEVRNTSPLIAPEVSRDDALMHSLVSTHIIMGVAGGDFISLLEPPAELQDLATQCQNVGWWPVLVGELGERDMLLASPIILYDYPQIAAESAGDLFDGTEIDEILSLRVMTLTDEEKNEIRQSDERARQILERTEAMPVEQFMKLHGAVRGLRPVKEDTA